MPSRRLVPARLALASSILVLAVATRAPAGAAQTAGLELVGSFYVDDNLHDGETVDTTPSPATESRAC